MSSLCSVCSVSIFLSKTGSRVSPLHQHKPGQWASLGSQPRAQLAPHTQTCPPGEQRKIKWNEWRYFGVEWVNINKDPTGLSSGRAVSLATGLTTAEKRRHSIVSHLFLGFSVPQFHCPVVGGRDDCVFGESQHTDPVIVSLRRKHHQSSCYIRSKSTHVKFHLTNCGEKTHNVPLDSFRTHMFSAAPCSRIMRLDKPHVAPRVSANQQI